jgi:hypothetical protein
MSLNDSFPWTGALVRQFLSRPGRILVFSFAVLFALILMGFRLQSFLIQRRIKSVASRMARLQLDQSGEKELRALLPELKLRDIQTSNGVGDPPASSDGKWYSYDGSNMEGSPVAWLMYHSGDHQNEVRRFFYHLGHRFCIFRAEARVREGIVDRTSLGLMVESGERIYGDAVMLDINGYGRSGWDGTTKASGLTYRDIAPYAERAVSKAPDSWVSVRFTPDAPDEYARALYDLHMNCLWNFAGCSTVKQMLPGIWPPNFPWRSATGQRIR